MKLLCVVPSYWPAFQFGGPIYSVHNLNKALVKKGIDVIVYTTNVGLDGKVPVNREVNVDGVKVTYFAFTKLFEFLGTTGWQFSLPMTNALRENLKKFDIVYIVSVWNYPVAIALYYCRKYKKPYIVSPRGLFYLYTAGKKSWKKLPYYYIIAKKGLRNASAIHYTTEDEMESCHSFFGLKNQAIVIPNGIDLSEFNNCPSREDLRESYPALKNKEVLLFLGRINWKKGVDILIKAFHILVKEKGDVHLLIVGDDDGDGYSEKVKQWVMDCGIWDRATFTGMLTGKDKLKAFAGGDIFVLPSYSENFGMAVVEAMACGVPVVISNKVGIYQEVEKKKAGVVVECDVESLYRGIKTLLSNENLVRELSINGKKLVEEYYEINKVADKMIEVYEEILKSKNKG